MDTLTSPIERTRVPPALTPETIYVAPLSLVETTVVGARVSHLVTLINGEMPITTPPGIGPDRHLRLAMNDICEPQEGLVLPCETHVEDLIRFALDWDRGAPLLIHCWAGISRSTAAAFFHLALRSEPGGRRVRACPSPAPRFPHGLSEPAPRGARRPGARPKRPHEPCGRADRQGAAR